LEKAREYNETALKMPEVPKFMIWGNIANILEGQDKFEEALEYYNKILKAEPSYFPAMMDKASVLSKVGKFEEAIVCIDAAIELAPEEPGTHYTKGNILRDSGSFGAAKKCFLKTIEIDPKNRAALINLGNLFFYEQKYEDAISYYDQALAISPDYFDTLMMKAMSLIKLRRFKEAEFFLRKCYRAAANDGHIVVVKKLQKTVRRRKFFLCRSFYFLFKEHWKWTWGIILTLLAIVIPILLQK
jgi:tetratricopeptide (TPR) repeat protein